MLLTQFVLERLLHRIAASAYAGEFLLKGAMLFAAWTGGRHRATRDLDLSGRGTSEVPHLVQVFREVASLSVEPDGVVFDASSVRAERIREDQVYEGVRVTMVARLSTARVGVQVDVGFGDAVHPAPEELQYPSLLGLPTPRLRVYPREVVVAEKFHAMVSLGEVNSRMKDFYDIQTLAERFAFAGDRLAGAIAATFARRGTELPQVEPVALRKEFANLRDKSAQWKAFVGRTRLVPGDMTLDEVVSRLHEFLWPVVRGARGSGPMPGSWPAGGPWS